MIWNDLGLVKYASLMLRVFFFLWTNASISIAPGSLKNRTHAIPTGWHTAKKVLLFVCVCGKSFILYEIYQNSVVWKPCFPYFFSSDDSYFIDFMSRSSFLSCCSSCSFRRCSFTSFKICISISVSFHLETYTQQYALNYKILH